MKQYHDFLKFYSQESRESTVNLSTLSLFSGHEGMPDYGMFCYLPQDPLCAVPS